MAAVYHNDSVDIELESGTVFRTFLNHPIGSGDNNANWYGVRVFRNAEPVNLTGCSVQGIFMPSSGSAILISDSTHTWVSENEAAVLLPQACYNVKGQFTLAIKIIGVTAYTTTGTVRIVDGVVADTYSENPVAETEAVPTYQEILAVYDQMVAAKKGSVRFDIEQELTAAQMTQARGNIAAASESDVSDLNSALTKYNSYNFLVPYPTEQSVYNGITWSWDGEICYYSGTSTSSSFYRLYWVDRYHMPEWMKPGETYLVEYKSTDNKVSFNCVFYKNGEVLSYSDYYLQSGSLTIPSDAEGAQIRIFMNGNVTANGSVSVALLNNYSNADLAEQIKNVFPLYVPSESTFSLWDDMPIAAYYNGFPSGFQDSIDEDLGLGQGFTYQVIKFVYRIYLSSPAAGDFFIGQKSYAGVQTWQRVSLGESFVAHGIVPTGTDIDTIRSPGFYMLTSSYIYTHSPFPSSVGGVLAVFPATTNTILQVVVAAGSGEYAGKIYFRTSLRQVFPSTWYSTGRGNVINNTFTTEHYSNTYNIECQPEITTDTNNFLPSTGDSTDRTGAIQAMLNSTGVCHLGTGDFYITGIELPNYGMLIGSGPTTRVILSSSVTNGYAIKLGSYSCVKDMRIVGSTTAITVSDLLVSGRTNFRHGILFEATGDAASGATFEYNATIENCHITDFSGGAITCNNTGISVDECVEVNDCHIKRCDAGVYVRYRSEFHHFNNVNATGCYYGCICNGGNCLFSNCNFSGNTVGILIDNQYDQSPNNAHGVFSCCKVAHSGGNTGIGIKVVGSMLCENFNGISFDYGHIVIENSNGVQFTGCRIGRNTVFDITNSTAIIFDACIIRDVATVTVNNTGSVTHFVNCYNSATGAKFDPLNE